MQSFSLPTSPQSDTYSFTGNSVTAGGTWVAWQKPKGKGMCHIFGVGSGGGGGNGAIGAASTAGGGGGGGAASCQTVVIPLMFLPDVLFISVPFGTTAAGLVTYVSVRPEIGASTLHLISANGGAVGGNASGATVGTAGAAGGITALTNMLWATSFMVSVAGIAGAAGNAGLNPGVSGARTGGGTGGASLGASGAAGAAGGSVTFPSSISLFPGNSGGIGSATATTAPGNGNDGFQIQNFGFFYGGTGGGATHGSATGAGLVQASGGNGAFGSGGGGSGGALTGSTPGTPGKGGNGLVIITVF